MPTIAYRWTSTGEQEISRHFDTITAKAKAMRAAMSGMGPEAAKAFAQVGTAATRASQTQQTAATKAVAVNTRAAAQAERAHEKAEAKKTSATEREIKKRERAEDAHYAKLMRDVDRQASAIEKKEAQAAKRRVELQRKAEKSIADSRAESIGSIGSSIAGGALGFGKYAGAAALGGLGLIVKDRAVLSDQATRLSINSRAAGTKGIDPSVLQREAESTALRNPGSTASDVLSAQGRYVAMTGDLDAARRMGGTFATASMASGANMTDIAATAATMSLKFGIKDDSQMKQAMASLIFGGKAGAFELSDMASYASEMGAAGSRFGLDKGVGGVKTLGGLAQIARGSTGDGAEAATSVRAMFSDLVEHSDKVKLLAHTDVFADKGKTKTNDIQDVLVRTISGTGGNQVKLGKIFGERGIKAVSGLVEAFNAAQGALGKGASEADKRAAGEAAMRKVLDESINATGDWNEVVQDSAAASQTYGAKLTAAGEMIESQIGSGVMPALSDFMDQLSGQTTIFETLGGAIGDMIDAASGYLAMMQDFGVLDRKKETGPTDAYKKNQKEIARIDAIEKSGGTLTRGEEAKRNRLRQENVELGHKVLEPRGGVAGGVDALRELGATAGSVGAATHGIKGYDSQKNKERREEERINAYMQDPRTIAHNKLKTDEKVTAGITKKFGALTDVISNPLNALNPGTYTTYGRADHEQHANGNKVTEVTLKDVGHFVSAVQQMDGVVGKFAGAVNGMSNGPGWLGHFL